MEWNDRVSALRELGPVAATDYPSRNGHREPYRYVTVETKGTAEQIAIKSGGWVVIAARIDGYITINVGGLPDDHVTMRMAISRDLTDDEIASYENQLQTSFAVTQP